jgi:hypothetical protein
MPLRTIKLLGVPPLLELASGEHLTDDLHL